jgi:hypothetical protein
MELENIILSEESLYIAILISTSKNALSFLLLLCLLFNKIRAKGRTGSAWKGGGWEMEGTGRKGRHGPNNICTCM